MARQRVGVGSADIRYRVLSQVNLGASDTKDPCPAALSSRSERLPVSGHANSAGARCDWHLLVLFLCGSDQKFRPTIEGWRLISGLSKKPNRGVNIMRTEVQWRL